MDERKKENANVRIKRKHILKYKVTTSELWSGTTVCFQ